jgi:hypothetical protein
MSKKPTRKRREQQSNRRMEMMMKPREGLIAFELLVDVSSHVISCI